MVTTTTSYEKELAFQADRRKASIELIKIVSDLWYENAIELVLFRNQLIDQSVSKVMNLYQYAGDFVNKPMSIFESVDIAQAIKNMNLPPAKIDIGKLTYEYHMNENRLLDTTAFVIDKLGHAKNSITIEPKDVVLYGFGRIGRVLARELMHNTGMGSQLRLRAIVIRGEINKEELLKRASLLEHDSVHGNFHGTVAIDEKNKALKINGTTVFFISASSPEAMDYSVYGIEKALLIDNTGAFRDKKSLNKHLKAKGIEKVLLTAPGKDIPNIIYGVNQKQYPLDKHSIFSAASCTTNAIAPILKVVEESLGIKKGHLQSVHAYTNDQNLVDNMHHKYRRGRAAAINMVITETGAGDAVSKALPSLKGKLTSNAIRVPVPNGSLAIIHLELEKKTTLNTINTLLKKYALEGDLVEQIKYSLNNELVSSDIIGASAPAIYDSRATIVSNDGKNITLYIWYDNEYGYSHQVMRLAKHIAKVRRYTYY